MIARVRLIIARAVVRFIAPALEEREARSAAQHRLSSAGYWARAVPPTGSIEIPADFAKALIKARREIQAEFLAAQRRSSCRR